MADPTAGDLKKALVTQKASWTVHPKFAGPNPIPPHPLGGIAEQMTVASATPPIDFKQALTDQPGNPFVYQRRVAQSLLPANPRMTVGPAFVSQLTRQPNTTALTSELKDVAGTS